MKYVVNTIWEHENQIDWKVMNENMNMGAKDWPKDVEVMWFKIDENTHGSVSIYPTEESYLQWQERLSELRKEASSEMKVKMVLEHKGPILAENKS